jgi:signal transduction histidine kinase
MNLTPFAWSGLLAGVFSLALGFLVFFKSQNKKLGRIWFLFALSVAGWGFGSMWIGGSKTIEEGLLACRLSYVLGVFWIAPLFYHFICIFLGLKRNRSIFIHYVIAFLFLLTIPTQLIFSRVRWVFDSFYYGVGGTLFPFLVLWWLTLVIYSHYELIRAFKTVSPVKKNQIKYFFAATTIGFTGGSLCYFPNFGIDVYPWGNFTVFLYPIIMTYAILQYNLMDIRILIRKTALFVAVYSALIVLTIPLVAWLQQHQSTQISTTIQVFQIILVGVVLSVGPFLYAYLVRRSVFFQEHTIAGLTHELKSPLAAIESALALLEDSQSMGQWEKGQLQTYHDMIQRNSKRLTSYVNELLHAFKPGIADFDSQVSVDFKKLCQSVIEFYSPFVEKKGLKLNQNFSSDEFIVQGNPSQIEQIISNVIGNALKFTDRGSIALNANKSSDQIEISVTDTGAGIPPDELPHLFDRFYQGETGKKKTGTGLGLAIAKIWVEAHGGKIWAESEGEGMGTTVTFTLPSIHS